MKVVVLGANGFIGSRLVEHLRELGHQVYERKGWEYDLRNPWEAHQALDCGADVAVNCAGWNGGLAYNIKYPARIYRDNTLIGLNVLDAAANKGVGRVLSLVASCGYPGHRQLMDVENYLWESPHSSVACHGEAKRNVVRASNFHRKQGLDAICLCPPTVYGPRDRTDPERTKFPMAMVKRMVDAAMGSAASVLCWGDGSPLREVLYVSDLVRLISGFVGGRSWEKDYPFSLPSGQEPSLKQFAEMAAEAAGYRGEIVWDGVEKGARRKKLINGEFRSFFPHFSFTPLKEGIVETVQWYQAACA